MVAALRKLPAGPPDPDQRVFLRDLTWKEFELILAVRGDRAGVRMTYLEGVLELMSPSSSHEGIKKALARMLEAWALERGIHVNGFGAWTLKNAPKERGVEPDECYVFGRDLKERPDLAIEVIWTSGGLDKLEVYRGLGVGEVWIWIEGVIQIHVLRGNAYERVDRSPLVPAFDRALAAHCIATVPDQNDAVLEFLAALRARTA